MSEGPEIHLNPDLDAAALKASFAKEKRLHIPNVINKDAAERLYQCLTREIAFNLAYNDDEGQKDLYASQQEKMTPEQWQALQRKVVERARAGKFQYLYGSFAVGDAYKQKLIDDLYVARFFEFVNSAPFLAFMREVTGAKEIVRASQQATAYGPGHFLTDHNDFDPEKDRKIAYVFNMTKGWRPEWGGVLQFLGDDGVTETGLIPSFNALNFFAVPQRHIVSQVANYAGAVRYALTGWLMAKRDPEN